MTIRELHQLAYTRLPKAQVHDYLHEAALALGAASLKDLSPAELAELAGHVRMLPQAARESVSRPSRPRSGRPSKPGVLKMITDAQIGFINRLASELGWTQSQLDQWLQRYHDAASVRHLGTSRDAGRAIRDLLAIKESKRRDRSRRLATGNR